MAAWPKVWPCRPSPLALVPPRISVPELGTHEPRLSWLSIAILSFQKTELIALLGSTGAAYASDSVQCSTLRPSSGWPGRTSVWTDMSLLGSTLVMPLEDRMARLAGAHPVGVAGQRDLLLSIVPVRHVAA